MIDTLDFFSGTGIHHKPFWDGHQHNVAGMKMTTRELCVKVKDILNQSTLLVYLDSVEDVILRYFISWYLLGPADVPLYVWVDVEVVDGKSTRQFFYETFQGSLKRFYVGKDMSVSKDVLESLQTPLRSEEGHTESGPLRYCSIGDCGKVSKHQITLKNLVSLDVCDDHKQHLSEQFSRAEESRGEKLAKKRESSRGKPRRKKMTEDEAKKLLAQMMPRTTPHIETL